MSYQNDLTQNNTDLQGILDTINALPEAGSGSRVETCTVNISRAYSSPKLCLRYLAVVDDEVVLKYIERQTSNPEVLTNVLVNSLMYFYDGAVLPECSATSGITAAVDNNYIDSIYSGYHPIYAFIHLSAGEIGTITITDNF